MLARSQLRAPRSISKRVVQQSSTRSWQPLLSRPTVVYPRYPSAQKRFYHNPNRSTPTGILRQIGSLYRNSPFAMSFWTVVVFGILLYGGATLQKRYETKEAVRKIYPDSVAKELEKAIWYTNERSNLNKAVEHYRNAILQTEKHGLSPISPEVVGIRIRIAETYEIFGEFEKAILELDDTKTFCQKVLIDRGESILPSDRIYVTSIVLKTSFKIADLHGSNRIQNSAAAERYLTEGIELMLKEQQRRQAQGISEEEQELENRWFSAEEMGAAFERFADMFAHQSKFYLAAPLYLRALMHCPKNCYAAVIMDKLAISLAQTMPDSGPNMSAEQEALLDNATSWAEQSLALAREIKPPERDELCDVMCASATHTLGVLAKIRNRRDEARRLYVEALSLAEATKHPFLIHEIRNALRILDSGLSDKVSVYSEPVVHQDPSRPTSSNEQ